MQVRYQLRHSPLTIARASAPVVGTG